MGNKQSGEDKQSVEYKGNCFITKEGDHVTRQEIFEAGAQISRLEETDSPAPIGDMINIWINSNVNYNADPANIAGPCDKH